MSKAWQLQDAKNYRFSELVDRTLEEGPQTVTRHGEPVVVIVAFEDYARRKSKKGSLLDFFRASPLKGVKLDLSRDETWDRDL